MLLEFNFVWLPIAKSKSLVTNPRRATYMARARLGPNVLSAVSPMKIQNQDGGRKCTSCNFYCFYRKLHTFVTTSCVSLSVTSYWIIILFNNVCESSPSSASAHAEDRRYPADVWTVGQETTQPEFYS